MYGCFECTCYRWTDVPGGCVFQMDEVLRQFDKYDKDGSGSISTKELRALISDVQGESMDDDEFEDARKQLDADDSGTV